MSSPFVECSRCASATAGDMPSPGLQCRSAISGVVISVGTGITDTMGVAVLNPDNAAVYLISSSTGRTANMPELHAEARPARADSTAFQVVDGQRLAASSSAKNRGSSARNEPCEAEPRPSRLGLLAQAQCGGVSSVWTAGDRSVAFCLVDEHLRPYRGLWRRS